MTTLGDRVKALREKLKLRPEHLAIAADVSVATIYNIECNKHKLRVDRLIPLAKALKVSPMYLLVGEEEESVSEREPTGVGSF